MDKLETLKTYIKTKLKEIDDDETFIWMDGDLAEKNTKIEAYSEILSIIEGGEKSDGIISPIIEPKGKSEMFLNMQYYMEYCQLKGYVTPQEWIEKHKHF